MGAGVRGRRRPGLEQRRPAAGSASAFCQGPGGVRTGRAWGPSRRRASFSHEAQSDLQEAKKLDPNNVQIYRYLAEVSVKKGEAAASRGNADQKNAAEQQADETLAEAVRVAGNVPEAHINVLTRKLTVAQRGTIAAAREQMKSLEPQYVDLTQRFASGAPVFAALGQFYSFYAAYLDSAGALEKLNRAIEVTEQAGRLDRRQCRIPDADRQLPLSQVFRLRRRAGPEQGHRADGESPGAAGAQDRPGPLQFANRVNRLALCSLLGKCCVERILMLPKSDATREGLGARLEKAVHEIGQIRGSGEDPEVVKWQGMLDLAKGETGQAVRSLYAAYQQIKAANPPEQRDPFLSYTLAKIFELSSETGAMIDFLGTALNSGIVYTKPSALLDYGDALLRAGSHDVVLNIVNVFRERFGGNDRSRVLGVKALIAKGALAEAEQEITKRSADDPNTVVLNLDLTRAKGNQLLVTMRQQGASDRAGRSDAMMDELRAHGNARPISCSGCCRSVPTRWGRAMSRSCASCLSPKATRAPPGRLSKRF